MEVKVAFEELHQMANELTKVKKENGELRYRQGTLERRIQQLQDGTVEKTMVKNARNEAESWKNMYERAEAGRQALLAKEEQLASC